MPTTSLDSRPIDISLFTPTHKPEGLMPLYQSLISQDEEDWQWVICPNNTEEKVPIEILQDQRVKLVLGAGNMQEIGALKRFACDHCDGSYFLEMDHDDLLMPNVALTHVKEAARRGAGFIYSDDAYYVPQDPPVREDGHPNWDTFSFDSSHGWETYPVEAYRNVLKATRTFDLSPQSLCQIYYAPDHLRCWHRDTYYRCGGHNQRLKVCDDQELLIKTYLSGSKMVHTGHCDYLYRYYPGNSVNRYQDDIVAICSQLKSQYLERLIEEYCRRNELKTLRGEIPLDAVNNEDGKTYGWIDVRDSLEYMSAAEVAVFFDAAYSKLEPRGYLTVAVPDSTTPAGFADLNYQTHFSSMSFAAFTSSRLKPVRKQSRRKGGFQQFSCDTTPIHINDQEGRILHIAFVAPKGGRTPGPREKMN